MQISQKWWDKKIFVNKTKSSAYFCLLVTLAHLDYIPTSADGNEEKLLILQDRSANLNWYKDTNTKSENYNYWD